MDETNEHCNAQVAELKAFKDKCEGIRNIFQDLQWRQKRQMHLREVDAKEALAIENKTPGGRRRGKTPDTMDHDLAEITTLLQQIQLLHNAHISEYEGDGGMLGWAGGGGGPGGFAKHHKGFGG